MNEGWARNVSGGVRWATLFTIRDTHFPRFTSFRSVHYPFHSFIHSLALARSFIQSFHYISYLSFLSILFLSLRLHSALYLSLHFHSIPLAHIPFHYTCSLRVFHSSSVRGKLLSYTHSVRVSLFPTLRFGRVSFVPHYTNHSVRVPSRFTCVSLTTLVGGSKTLINVSGILFFRSR